MSYKEKINRDYRQKISLALNEHSAISFAQFGEDLVLMSLISTYGRIEGGFYVDVGAFHSFQYSNFAVLREQFGWSGILVEANPTAAERLRVECPRDLVVNTLIDEAEADHEFVIFDHGSTSSADVRMIERQNNNPYINEAGRITIRSKTLTRVLDENISSSQQIDALSIDVEGLDLRVLRSLDFSRYKPTFLLVEDFEIVIDLYVKKEIHQFIVGKGYRLVSACFVTKIYMK